MTGRFEQSADRRYELEDYGVFPLTWEELMRHPEVMRRFWRLLEPETPHVRFSCNSGGGCGIQSAIAVEQAFYLVQGALSDPDELHAPHQADISICTSTGGILRMLHLLFDLSRVEIRQAVFGRIAEMHGIKEPWSRLTALSGKGGIWRHDFAKFIQTQFSGIPFYSERAPADGPLTLFLVTRLSGRRRMNLETAFYSNAQLVGLPREAQIALLLQMAQASASIPFLHAPRLAKGSVVMDGSLAPAGAGDEFTERHIAEYLVAYLKQNAAGRLILSTIVNTVLTPVEQAPPIVQGSGRREQDGCRSINFFPASTGAQAGLSALIANGLRFSNGRYLESLQRVLNQLAAQLVPDDPDQH